MKWILTVFLLLLAPLARAGEVTDVDTAALAQLQASGVPVVDIRMPAEWRQTGVIPGAGRVTFVDETGQINPAFEEELAKIAKPDQPVALICRTGHRSQAAARLLSSRGYGRVYNVREGMMRWISEGRPTSPCDRC